MKAVLLTAGLAAVVAGSKCAPEPEFKYLVTFGDSYSDDGRLDYYFAHNGSGPPPGVMQPQSGSNAGGRYAWTQDVANYTGATNYDYAVDGATCSNEIISRYLAGIHEPFPSVMDDEMPSFLSDLKTPLYAGSTPENTVYALWIGTNDIGWQGFLSDSQRPGTNLTTFIECVWSVFDSIYEAGGRRFVILNQNALQLVAEYRTPELGGAGNNQYWQNKTLYNMTEYSEKIMEYTTTVNMIIDYGVPFNMLGKRRWPGAKFGVFDVHSLLTEMYNNPEPYLDPPYNVTGYYHHCNPQNNSDCTYAPGSLDSYLW